MRTPAHKFKVSLFISAVLLLAAGLSFADTPPQQVAIESKIVEVNDKQARELGVSYLIYQNLNERDAKAEFAFVVTPEPDNKTKIEVTSLVYGRGADYRRWVPQNPILTIQPATDASGNINMTLRPEKTDKIYIDKPSIASPIAPLLFAAIGSQYESDGAKAASSPGTPCSSSHGGSSSGGGVKEGIDRVGMAAGMGLLASQAKGQLEGQKVTFLSDFPIVSFLFKTEAYNKDKKQLIVLVTPRITDINE